eukprot:scaffold6705_cov205-Pinguiococcus_pyrenoidosus.AAC.1
MSKPRVARRGQRRSICSARRARVFGATAALPASVRPGTTLSGAVRRRGGGEGDSQEGAILELPGARAASGLYHRLSRPRAFSDQSSAAPAAEQPRRTRGRAK